VLGDSHIALRLANLIQVSPLFLVGFRWARHSDGNRWFTGFAIAGLSVALVAVSVALGG
jgi:hypothetical protein